jgi:hypothetical protein
MIDRRRLFSWVLTIALACLALGSSGCSEELGPERMEVVRVKGFVKEGIRPVSDGWIEFFPVDGTVGNLCSARIHADGSFEADHVPVGVNLIRLVNTPLSSKGAKQVFGAYTSPIRRTIPPQTKEPLLIDLVDEALLWRSAQSARTAADAQGSGGAR